MKAPWQTAAEEAAAFLAATVAAGDTVIAAVSGGADSMALLDLLLGLQARLGITVEVAHVHHHLRAASDAEWGFVEGYCQERGVPFHGRHVDVPAARAATGRSLEACAHDLRHQALAEVCDARGAQWLALAHQANDRAETLLMNILRGTGPAGLAAMPQQNGRILRPLLSFTRAQVEAYLAARGIDHVTDESNNDTTILRNRVRHELLPLLATYNPAVVTALGRLAASSACDQDLLRQRAAQLYETSLVLEARAWCLLRRGTLAAAHPAELAALLRETVQRLAAGRSSLHAQMLDHVRVLVGRGQGRYDLGQGLICECTRHFVYIGRRPQGDWHCDADGIWRHDFLEAAVTVPTGTVVRGLRPGDVIHLPNLGRKTLKKVLQESALPLCLRPVWPLLDDIKLKEIIWLPFLAPDGRLMYYNSVTFLKVKCTIQIAQHPV